MFNFGSTTKPTSVDGVLSIFKETIANLQDVAAMQKEEADFQETVIVKAASLKEAAEAEAQRATTIAAQMQAVFN